MNVGSTDVIIERRFDLLGETSYNDSVYYPFFRYFAGLFRRRWRAPESVEIHTTKSAISRLENLAESITLATLEKVARALGKEVHIELS